MAREWTADIIHQCQVDFCNPREGVLQASFIGNWLISAEHVEPETLIAYLEHYPDLKTLSFDTTRLVSWDSSILAFLLALIDIAEQHAITIDGSGLPDGISRLLNIAKAMPAKIGVRKFLEDLPILDYVGTRVLQIVKAADEMIMFIGELYKSFARLILRRARFSWRDVMALLQDNGVASLLMVCFISYLIGITFAFIEAVQLKLLGSQIFLANVMSIALVRELSPIMTAIIMAGRTGAAYAANIGLMQTNDEINALQTTGISPHDFVVMPRVIVLMLIMPILYLYSVIFGMLGSISIDVSLLGVTATEYLNRAADAVGVSDLMVGLSKSLVFGFMIAIWGCYQGMRCRGNGVSIGDAVRHAVVLSILSIIGMDALLTTLYHIVNW